MAHPPPSLMNLSLPPFAALQPQQQQQPVASTSHAHTRLPRKRLPPEANAILNDYARTQGLRPDKATRQVLWERVQRVPGSDWYTLQHVDRFFQTKRKAASKASRYEDDAPRRKPGRPKKASDTVDSILWPSLKEDAIKKLHTLFENNPEPTSVQIGIWAEVLEADAKDISVWIRYKRPTPALDGNDEESEDEDRLQHLPTPEPTASPEPFYRSVSTSPTVSNVFSPISPVSPVHPPFVYYAPGSAQGRERSTPLRQVTTSHSSPEHKPTVLPPPHLTSAPHNPSRSTSASSTNTNETSSNRISPIDMLHDLAKIWSAPEPDVVQAPLTPREANALLAPLQTFMDRVHHGDFATFGLMPSVMPGSSEGPKTEPDDPMDDE